VDSPTDNTGFEPKTAEQVIVNPTGLHARPCHAIASLAADFESSLQVGTGDRAVDGRSILSLMTLGACEGDVLRFQAQGRDADALLAALCDLVSSGFREMS